MPCLKLSQCLSAMIAGALIVALCAPAQAAAQACYSTIDAREEPAAEPGSGQSLEVFSPYASRLTRRVDYSDLGFILKSIVIEFGRSSRVSYQGIADTGSHIKVGHSGAAAMEGNRVFFSRITPKIIKILSRYRRDLEALGTSLDFSDLTRDQQLAYWYNLHNVTVIEQIALHYPVKFPEKLHPEATDAGLSDAKILKVKDIPLSLRDIRSKIVYAHWQDDPLVLYGFFHGWVGGPSVLPEAFTGENVHDLLAQNATEFINSLRGARKYGSKIHVSEIYCEGRSLFPHWQSDLRAHLLIYADALGRKQIANDLPLVIRERYRKVADLYGGVLATPSRAVISYKNGSAIDGARFPPYVQRMLQGLYRKKRRLARRNRNMQKNRVVIVGEDQDANVQERSEAEKPEP